MSTTPAEPTNPWATRHPSVSHFDRLFAYAHLSGDLAPISQVFADVAVHLLGQLQDGPELTVALRKLLEAKDAAVRQAVIDRG